MIRRKLGLGVVVALGTLAARRKPGQDSNATDTHPHPLERLPFALTSARVADNDALYAFAIAALQMNMTLTDYVYAPLSDASFSNKPYNNCIL